MTPRQEVAGSVDLPLIILGGGGHARVLMDLLRARGARVLGFTDPDEAASKALGIARLGGDDVIDRYDPAAVRLVNGLGSTASTAKRRALYERWHARGYRFETAVHPAAVVAAGACLADGVQVMAGAVVQTGSRCGENTIINTRAAVDHDCRLGAHVHVAPGATLSGAVQVGEGAHIGTGASVIQGIAIGAGSVVGAGAVVLRDVPAGVTVAGVPARVIGTPHR